MWSMNERAFGPKRTPNAVMPEHDEILSLSITINGRCVAANRAATSAGSADANTVPKYLELTYRSASWPLDAVKGTAIVKSDGDGGALASSD
jgi:hypothetical protein